MHAKSSSGSSRSIFDAAHRRAKVLEARLEQRVQAYSSYCGKIDAASYNDKDIEGGMCSSHEEQALVRDVDMDLTEMTECIDTMRSYAEDHNQQEVLKRFHEVHFDYSSEYRKSTTIIHSKRESAQLFRGASTVNTAAGAASGEDSAVNRLLRERSGIANSMRGVNEAISQAFDAKGHLLGQRGMIGTSSLSLGRLARSIPGFGKLVDGLSRKKFRENAVVAAFCGVLLCFTIWWMFLR
jgi:hypothetical protein